MLNKILEKSTYLIRNKLLYKNDPPIVLAGMGRCGTTLTTLAIKNIRGYSNQFVNNIDEAKFRNKNLYKTHDYPNIKQFPDNLRVIFMFGNVNETIISISSKMNIKTNHLTETYHVNKVDHNEILYHDDILNLEPLFDAWNSPQAFSFISIRYETLYSERTLNMLNSYLGFKVKFPPYKKRRSDEGSYPYIEPILKTYSSLSTKIEQADDCKIWE